MKLMNCIKKELNYILDELFKTTGERRGDD